METREILQDICGLIGLPLDGLDDLTLTGQGPISPSSFKVGAAAQAAISASALAASRVWHQRGGKRQAIAVDMRHALIEFRSERFLQINGGPPPALWDKIAGTYQTSDSRWIRLHTNFPHHRDGVLELLDCAYDREAVAAALGQWRGQDFEDAAAEKGLVATMMRSPEEWQAHPQAQALDQQPLISVEWIGDAPAQPLSPGARPLDGVRVLDLTRIIAGPVCGRTLAAHGADVMRVTAPHLPSVAALVTDAGRGKLSTHIDLRQEAGRENLRRLIAESDILVQGYRPGGLERWGFGPENVAKMRPGIIHVSLSAYGHVGPCPHQGALILWCRLLAALTSPRPRPPAWTVPRPCRARHWITPRAISWPPPPWPRWPGGRTWAAAGISASPWPERAAGCKAWGELAMVLILLRQTKAMWMTCWKKANQAMVC